MTPEAARLSLWTGQGLHAAWLALLLAATVVAHAGIAPLEGKFLCLSSDTWFWASIVAPVLHQVYVWLCWRLELLRSNAISRSLGFSLYQAGFLVLISGRVATLAPLAWANRGSLPLPVAVGGLLTVLLLLPSVYALYSVVRYFGMSRAAGADHFDERYRTMPLVREGIFRWTSNGMYGVAFLGFWALAFALGSAGALIAAAFNHAYIWVHFYATEKPDMKFIYGSRDGDSGVGPDLHRPPWRAHR